MRNKFGTSLGEAIGKAKIRIDGRSAEELRKISYEIDPFGYADASVLLRFGGTAVMASVTMQPGAPAFARNEGKGWLSAEYAMLPMATRQRTNRESSSFRRNSRSVEISRLIGRVLRASVDLRAIPERNVIIDCDVLQADGGTRVTAITAASMALQIAEKRWHQLGIVSRKIVKERIVAVAVGVVGGRVMADINQSEDSGCDVDLNFVMTENGEAVEVQGTAERGAISWDLFEEIRKMAVNSAYEIAKKTAVDPSSVEVPERVAAAMRIRWRIRAEE